VRLSELANRPLVGALLVGMLAAVGCAERSYQLPVQSPPAATAAARDGVLPPPPPPSRRGVILPGDPASGTGQLGTGSGVGEIPTQTGTSGTRVTPSDGTK
jgi:hypothetical protein